MRKLTRLVPGFLATLMTIVLAASLVATAPAARAEPTNQDGGEKTGLGDIPKPKALKAAPVSDAEPPSLVVKVATEPRTVEVGQNVKVTVTVDNQATQDARDLRVTMPVPEGADPLGGTGKGGWEWTRGTLKDQTSVSYTAEVKVSATPPGRALVFHPRATAEDLEGSIEEVGGALVTEPSKGPGKAQFTPGQEAVLKTDSGQVEVTLSPNAAAESLTLQASREADKRAKNQPLPPAVAGFTEGLETVFLDAINAGGTAVHQLAAPVKITVAYTPEQLQVAGLGEDDLTIFWYDEGKRNWVPLATDVDPATTTATAEVDHLGTFQLGDDLSPSAAFIPSVQGWQVNHQTGSASFSYPIEVPAGPGGIKPSLELSYNSASTDGGSGLRPKLQAGWVGKGWSLEPGSVSRNKITINPDTDQWIDHFALTVNGQSFDLVQAEPLAGNTGDEDKDPTHWAWRPTHESFIRARAVPNGTSTDGSPGWGGMVNGTWQPRHTWKLWEKNGTVHEFSRDLWWGFDRCAVANSMDFEAYRWLHSKTIDTHGNQITYEYDRKPRVGGQQGCDWTNYARGTVDQDTWPTSITWGANVATGSVDRYKIDFLSTIREKDRYHEGAGNQYLGPEGQPRQTRQLNAVAVSSKEKDTWELVRRYNLTYDYSLLSDQTVRVNGVYSGNITYPKLTLKSVERVASDGATALPRQTFAYHTTRGTSDHPNGGWNRLARADNGQGGTDIYDYDNIATVHGPLFSNHHRVKTRTLEDGRGNRPAWQFDYGTANVNSLGTTLMGDGNGTQANPNSAVLYFNEYWDPGHRYDTWLAHRELKEFRGHETTKETAPDGTSTEHSFYLGDEPCGYPKDTAGRPLTGDRIHNDACFQKLRDREFLKGREYRTVVRTAAGRILTASEREFAVEFGGYSDTLTGLWRAFTYTKQEKEHTYNGAGQLTDPHVTKTTRYSYDPIFQAGGRQYGNLTSTEEYGNSGALERVSQRHYATRDDDGNGAYLVDRVSMEVVRDGEGRLLALSHNFYDHANQSPTVISTKGELTRTTRYYNVPLQADTLGLTLHGTDTTYGYDPYGNGTTTTTYEGPSTRVWNGGGNIAISPPGGGTAARTTRVDFDEAFHALPEAITGPTGLEQTTKFDRQMGTMTSATDFNGNTAMARYDVFGRLVKLIKPGDTEDAPTVAAFYFDSERPFRHVVCTREVAGQGGCRPMQSFYDGLGRHIQTKSETAEGTQNVVVDKVYNGLGWVVRQSQPRYRNETPSTTFWQYVPPATDAEMRWTTTSYDGLGRPTVAVTPGGSRTEQRYGVDTQSGGGVTVQAHIDANRHRSEQRHDAFGRLVNVAEFSGECDNSTAFACGPNQGAWAEYGATTYAYSPLDLLTSVTDNEGNRTTISYDSLGRKLAMSDPDMGAWRYAYDPNGNLVGQTDAMGKQMTFRYDALERLTAKVFPDHRESVYRYDEAVPNGKGQRTSMSTATETTKWHYDARSRPTQTSHTIDGVTRSFQREYDSADRLQSVTYPSSEKVTYRYDAGWRPTSLCSDSTCYVKSAKWTALDQPVVWQYGNSVLEDLHYENPSARLSQIKVGSHFDHSYRYDSGGKVRGITDNLPGGATQSFDYDHRDRLVSWTPSATEPKSTYAYNAIGNLTNKDGMTYDYAAPSTPNGGPHAVKAKGTETYRYDANGNLLSGGGREITWTAENLPATVKGPDGVVESYGYDGDGARVTSTRAGVRTTYVEDLWEETSGEPAKSHYTFNDRVVAVSDGKNVTYLHGDHLGSVSAATNQSGGLASRQEFDPWGKVRSGGVGQTDVNYTGQRLDDTGLLYYRARMYDPSLARFLSADTVVPMPGMSLRGLTVGFQETPFLGELNGENRSTAQRGFAHNLSENQGQQKRSPSGPADPAHLNRYSYALNDPLTYTDPSGHVVYDEKRAQEVYDFLHDRAIPALEDLRWWEQAAWTAGVAAAVVRLKGEIAMTIGAVVGAPVAMSTPDPNGTQEAIDTFKWMEEQLDNFLDRAPAGATIEFYFYIGRDGKAYLVAVTRSKSGEIIGTPQSKQVSYQFVSDFKGGIGRVVDPYGWFAQWDCRANTLRPLSYCDSLRDPARAPGGSR